MVAKMLLSALDDPLHIVQQRFLVGVFPVMPDLLAQARKLQAAQHGMQGASEACSGWSCNGPSQPLSVALVTRKIELV